MERKGRVSIIHDDDCDLAMGNCGGVGECNV